MNKNSLFRYKNGELEYVVIYDTQFLSGEQSGVLVISEEQYSVKHHISGIPNRINSLIFTSELSIDLGAARHTQDFILWFYLNGTHNIVP